MSNRTAIIMAAGKGTRMKSELPKVLFPVLGRPMVEYVLDVMDTVKVNRKLLVVGYRSDLVRATLSHRPGIDYVEQTEQLGTGHAVMMCREKLQGQTGPVLIVAGDCPMIQPESVEKLFAEYETSAEYSAEHSAKQPVACILGTAHKENPFGLGRIVRDTTGHFERIVEEKDTTDEQKQITEVNMSYYIFHIPKLVVALEKLTTNNSQKEYYLTDVPAILRQMGETVLALPVLKPIESLGINTIDELAAVEQAMATVTDIPLSVYQ